MTDKEQKKRVRKKLKASGFSEESIDCILSAIYSHRMSNPIKLKSRYQNGVRKQGECNFNLRQKMVSIMESLGVPKGEQQKIFRLSFYPNGCLGKPSLVIFERRLEKYMK